MPDFYKVWHSKQIEHANFELIGIDDLDPKLQICKIGPKTEMCFIFCEIWHLEQIGHANYAYSTWN